MELWQVHLAFAIVVTVVAGQEAYLEIQPKSPVVSKEIGASLALTCKPVARDTSLITQLEWFDPRQRRIDSTNRANPVYVQGRAEETGSVLIFSKISENDEGNYTCRAFYSNTEKLVTSVQVSTYVRITFVDAPENQYPIVDKNYKIKCEVKGNPPPDVEWNKNDQPISTGDRYIVESDGLTIRNVKESDDGVYKCTALVLKTGEITSRDIKVEVQVPPKVLPMSEISVVEGETASIRCNATGKPPPEYSWIKTSTREDLSKTSRFSVKAFNGELLISKVETYDNAVYKCTAKNAAGESSFDVKINVLMKPKIYELINITAPIKSTTKITCKVQGRPLPIVQFRKLSNKEPFDFGQQKSDMRITQEFQNFEEKGETFASLIISDVNRTDDGLYECRATNKAGQGYQRGHITVEFPPTFERTKNLSEFWTWADHPGNLSCIPEAIPNATIIWKFQQAQLYNNSQSAFTIYGTGPRSNLVIRTGGDRRYFGFYECIASNKMGTDTLRLNLREATIPGPVQQVKAQSLTATTIHFNIVPPGYFGGVQLRSISVQYRPERAISWDNAYNHTWSFGAPYILEGLTPETTYHFRFAARNDVGIGQWINAQSISMPRRSQPAHPKIVYPSGTTIQDNTSDRIEIPIVVSPYADHYDLRWSVPNDNGDPIIRYEIKFCLSERINGDWRESNCQENIQISVEYNNYEITGLLPDKTYKIEVFALNAIGSSNPGQIRVKTARGQDPIVPVDQAAISSGTIIGIVVAAVLLVLLVVDIACFCVNRTGILALIFQKTKSKKHDDDESKLGREETEPLKAEMNHHHMNGQKEIRSTYDGRQVRTGFDTKIIGKNSAV